ncbi:MAG: hypothetical protein K6F76_03990 [Clostridiales bacterium]|nr:hypothetical protein [Clostridiales bacterium]
MSIDKEKLQCLFRFMEEYINISIYEVLNDSLEDRHFSAIAVSNIIKCYIDIENQMRVKLPYNDIKSYFEFSPFTREEYDLFEKSRLKESKYYRGKQFLNCNTVVIENGSMNIDEEKLKYLFEFIDEYIDIAIDEILGGASNNLHLSAVDVSNIIKCYIYIEKQLYEELPYNDVKSYFEFNAYTKEEYELFEKNRLIQSKKHSKM